MKQYQFIDEMGTFRLPDPETTNYLYFPLANERGVMSSITPLLGGDSKTGQHNFLLQPVSSEELHNNKSTRNFWVLINGKEAWSATGVSVRQQAEIFTDEKEETVLEAGIMWHQVTRHNKILGISSVITSFVPATGETSELMKVLIRNESAEEMTIIPTAAVPIYGRSADNIRDHRHVTSLLHRIKTTSNGVLVHPTLAFDERGHQQNHWVYGVFGKSEKSGNPTGFFPVVDDFIGNGGSLENPEAIMKGTLLPVSCDYTIDGYEALGGLRFAEVVLKPGEESVYILSLSYGDEEGEMKETAAKLLSEAFFEEALKETRSYWKHKINVSCHTGDKNFDNWMYWVNFQPMLRRIYGCSFLPHHDYGKGGRGWRDLWQDCLALLIMNPQGVREMILNNFAGVRIDGTNATIIGSKPGEFIADRNNITRVWMDHGFWPFLTTKLYIEQSADLDLLLEEVVYFKDNQADRGEEKDENWSEEQGNLVRTDKGGIYRGTVLEHLLLQNLTAFYDVGEHNNLRLRGADWNDALDMAGERGESVAFTAAYAGNLSDMAELLKELKEKKDGSVLTLAEEISLLLEDSQELYDSTLRKKALLQQYHKSCRHTVSGKKVEVSIEELIRNLKKKSQWIKDHIRKEEWITDPNGYSWFNSYYDNKGRRVEGDHPSGVRMMLTGQVFTIMSGTATEAQCLEIIKAADNYLYKKEAGGYRLNTDFREVKTDLGRMFGFAYGHKENGAVFSHMAVMYANALYRRGFAKEAYKVINTLYNQLSDFEKSRVYPGITEYIDARGYGLYHYLTGAASWLLLTVLTEMYGVKGKYGTLVLKPRLLKEQFDKAGSASISLSYRERKFKVEYLNKSKKEFGEYQIGSIRIDGILYGETTDRIEKHKIMGLDKESTHHISIELQ